MKRIRVLDDKETWFPSPGEMVFDVVVAPNSDPDRLMRRRIPAKGHIHLSDGESRNLNVVVFDGYLKEGASLDFAIGGPNSTGSYFSQRWTLWRAIADDSPEACLPGLVYTPQTMNQTIQNRFEAGSSGTRPRYCSR